MHICLCATCDDSTAISSYEAKNCGAPLFIYLQPSEQMMSESGKIEVEERISILIVQIQDFFQLNLKCQ